MCKIKNLKKILFLTFFFLGLSVLTCFAAEEKPVLNVSGVVNRGVSVDPVEQKDGYSAVLYTNTNGLPTSEANAITQTSDGFIWIGSYAGLIRYDGESFERMDSTTGVSNVRSLYVDDKDRLWVGTNDSGVFMMHRDELKNWNRSDGLDSASIRSISQDVDGYIYVGTTEGIAAIDSELNIHILSDGRVSESTIHEMRPAPDGMVYGLSTSGDIFTLKDGEIKNFIGSDAYTAQGVNSILPDPEKPGYVYLGAEGSQVYYGNLTSDNLRSLTVRDISPLSELQSLEYLDGQIWLCARGGIGKLSGNGVKVLTDVPMDNSVGHVMTDYEGNLWFTSMRQGVMKIVPNQFADLFARYGLKDEVVNSTCMCGDMMFVGTDDGLMVIKDGEALTSLPLKEAVTASGRDLKTNNLIDYLNGIRIRSIISDSKGRLWISTWRDRGLVRYDDGKVMTFTPDNGMISDRVRMVHELSDGTIVVANTGGVSLINEDKVIGSYTEKSGIEVAEILTIAEGYNHELLLGSDGGGIYVIGNGKIRHIGTDDGLDSEVILRIKRSRYKDLFWIVTSNSIAYMTPDLKVTTVKEFPYPNNYDLIENSKGDAWILASDGIYRISADELIANKEITPVHYGMASGIPYVATANSYSELTEEGDLYIASSSGIVEVNIEKPFEDVNELKMSVPFVDADSSRIYPDAEGTFTVPSDTHKLTVNCFVYNYSLTDPQVSYHLDGFDKEVTTVRRSDLGPIDYTNLRGGSYDFVVQLKDSMGRGSREKTIHIVKERAFYEETWFYLLSALSLMLIIFLIVRLILNRRITMLTRRAEEQGRLFDQTATALVNAIDAKDRYTHGHSARVAEYSKKLAWLLGKSEQECKEVYYAGLLHDVGKIGIPLNIINKEGKLTDEEYEIIKQHPALGAQILKSIKEYPFLSIGANYHHERFDGRGYPEGLKGEDIPEIARIVAVADAYDAMTSRRSYRDPIPQQKVREELIKGSGTQFDPDIARQMQHLIDLDTEYDMQEKEEMKELHGESAADNENGGSPSEGILINDHMVVIRLKVSYLPGRRATDPLPSMVLFDSLDAKLHTDERNIRELLYFEYGRIRFDGETEVSGARKMQTKKETGVDTGIASDDEYRIEAVRIKDHVLIKTFSKKQTNEVIIALPDSVRFSYIGFSSMDCRISNVMIDRAEEKTEAGYIPRIAEEISYIDGPEGDLPNVQIDGYRADSTDGILIKESMKISFHTMSLPTARLVWHCAYLVIFTSDNGKVDGENYREYALIRPDGESWEDKVPAKNTLTVEKLNSFKGWDAWKEKNKEGYDSTAKITKKGDTITVTTENLGIYIKNVTEILDDAKDIYVAITGDQCAVTNIRIE
ncbi:MAG: HD domain-containing protein [Lachnospiraceae bacterium]|nr:HD domain-containing protein [Lachnospiraceae bacterium]